MKKRKKIEPQFEYRTIYLHEGTSLSDIIKQVMTEGVTDLSSVKYDHTYESCPRDHGEGQYCYCSPTYSEMRFCYTVEVK